MTGTYMVTVECFATKDGCGGFKNPTNLQKRERETQILNVY